MTNNANKNNKKNQFQGGPKNLIIGVAFMVACILILARLTDYTRATAVIPYSTFLSKVEQDQVKAVNISGQDVRGKFKDGSYFETTVAENSKDYDLLKAHGVEFSIANSGNQFNMWYFSMLLIALGGLLLVGWFIYRQAKNLSNGNGGGGAGNIFSVGKSRAKMFMPSTIKENFNSVAGANEAKEELKDLVDYLKNPEK